MISNITENKVEKNNENITEDSKIQSKNENIRYIEIFILKLIGCVVFLYVIFFLIFGLHVEKNNDMLPKICAGDICLYYRIGDEYIGNAAVVYEKNGKESTGRVVAVPGDVISVTEAGTVEINGNQIMESEIYYDTTPYDFENSSNANVVVNYPVTLGENEYFILGDYRTASKDSRFYGPIKTDDIKGEVILVLRRKNL
jgi:signal peptidase I